MADELLEHIGKTIRAVRQEQGSSLEEIAFAAGLSYFYLSQIEHGRRNLTIRALYKIAAALGIKPVSLLPGQPLNAGPQGKPEVLKTLRKLQAQIKDL
ncbi:MAG: helix-turn-helix domain-containing protein [Candidatus Margulisbacteria bacterium]|jgi:transcriptional regulator with XRE-family HTH domain|nr:helix-turn-helix domain-containing protein [Candidatus Margulisiibacteriota bacterium]